MSFLLNVWQGAWANVKAWCWKTFVVMELLNIHPNQSLRDTNASTRLIERTCRCGRGQAEKILDLENAVSQKLNMGWRKIHESRLLIREDRPWWCSPHVVGLLLIRVVKILLRRATRNPKKKNKETKLGPKNAILHCTK